MTTLENTFVRGLVYKTFLLGGVSALLSGLIVSWPFAGAVALGTVVSGFNLQVVGWVSKKMAESAVGGDTGATKWVLLLVVKLLLLFALTFVIVIVVGADAVGYVVGYSAFLPAIVWQGAVSLGREDLDDVAEQDFDDTDTEQ